MIRVLLVLTMLCCLVGCTSLEETIQHEPDILEGVQVREAIGGDQEQDDFQVDVVDWLAGYKVSNVATFNATPYEERAAYKDREIIFRIEEISEETLQRIMGISYKDNSHIKLEDLRFLSVGYVDYDGNQQKGELIVNQSIAEDMLAIFLELYSVQYPIHQMKLVDEYDGDDNASMVANNTSAFNYRVVAGSSNLSNHAYGLAIDINPLVNPYVTSKGIFPIEGSVYADRTLGHKGMIVRDDPCYKAFIARGFRWGGDWTNSKDYQHFDVKIKGVNQ